MAATHLFAGVAVSDHTLALDWYGRFFGRPPDLTPNEREAAWELAPGAWLYFLDDPARAGGSFATLLVDDLDGFLAALGSRGIASEEPHEVIPGTRAALVSDPDGNTIQLGEPPAPGA